MRTFKRILVSAAAVLLLTFNETGYKIAGILLLCWLIVSVAADHFRTFEIMKIIFGIILGLTILALGTIGVISDFDWFFVLVAFFGGAITVQYILMGSDIYRQKHKKSKVEVPAVSPKPQSDLSRTQLYNQGLYFIEYELIPMFIEDVKKDSNREFFLKFIHLWEKGIIKELYFIDWDDLSCEIFGDEMTEYIILYDFPTPFDIPLAKYGAVYINKQKQIYSYYTLEKSLGGYMLCSTNSESHINYGKREDMTKIEFIREICILQNINESSLKGWRLEKGKKSVSEYIDLRGNVYKNQSSKSVGPTMIELKDDDYDNYIANNPRVIVCFYDYNGPSKMMMDILSECAINYKDKIAVAIYDVYGDRNEIIRTKLNIMAMPTFLIYKNGEVTHKHIGLCDRDTMKKMFVDLLS